MFSAYFDDSGGRDTNTIVIAGYVAPPLQWAKFKEEWNWILDSPEYALPPSTIFHMRDFAHSKRAFCVFEKHQDNPEVAFKRQRFIESLIGSTKVRATMSFSCSFRLEDYEKVDAVYKLKETFGGPLSLAGRTCAGRVRHWGDNRKTRVAIRDIEFVFEDGMKDKGDLKDVMRRDGFREPTFQPKGRDWPPLQAADLIAWEFHKAMKQAFANELIDLRESFDSLMKMPGDNGVFSSADDLLSRCVIPMGVEKR